MEGITRHRKTSIVGSPSSEESSQGDPKNFRAQQWIQVDGGKGVRRGGPMDKSQLEDTHRVLTALEYDYGQ